MAEPFPARVFIIPAAKPPTIKRQISKMLKSITTKVIVWMGYWDAKRKICSLPLRYLAKPLEKCIFETVNKNIYIVLFSLLVGPMGFSQKPPENIPPKMQQLFLGLPYVDISMVEEEKYDIKGPWKLSEVVAQRFGLDIIEGYDQRLDTLLAYHAAYQYFNFLVKKYKSDALWAYLEGPLAFEKSPIGDRAKKQWIEALDGGKSMNINSGPVYDFVWGPQVWPKGKSFDEFYRLNPSITGNVKDSTLLIVRVDSSTKDVLDLLKQNQIASIAFYKKVEKTFKEPPVVEKVKEDIKSWIVYKVIAGDNLGKISNRYNVSVADLKEWNSLRSDMIRVGQKLTVKTAQKKDKEVIVLKTKDPKNRFIDPKAVVYVVQPGETLWSISQQFQNLSAEDLMKYNDITEDIRPGDEVLIPPTVKNK